MKNLLIYIHPRKDFDEEHKALVRIQIDNSLRFWDREDIIIVTNFAYEYNGIRPLVLDDSLYCDHWSQSSKINCICHLFSMGVMEGLCWFHDFDAYQLSPITKGEFDLGDMEAGFTDYGWSEKWNTGSFFFGSKTNDIFKLMREKLYEHRYDEEKALMSLAENNVDNINARIKRLNITYNIGMNKVGQNLQIADKPLKVIHFHPKKPGLMERFKPLMDDGLKEIFKTHGYQ